MEARRSVSVTFGAPSAGSLAKSLALHSLALALLLLVPAEAIRRAPRSKKEIDIVFYRPPRIEAPAPSLPLPGTNAAPAGSPAPAAKPRPNAPAGPEKVGRAELPPGPGEGVPVEAPPDLRQKVGNAGILAFKDTFASLARDKVGPRLGSAARVAAADEVGQSSSRSMLATSTPGSSGGINTAALSRNVGGGGGGGGGGGNGGGGSGTMPGVGVGRATSPIASIGGGDRPLARGGLGPSRTDEEIQIVFDRYKSAFYRMYNRELRSNPTLQGQMVLRLTIEPDGSVSMCVLQSTDMKAPDLAAQVVDRVKTINFGAKEGVQALTIVYPIDFLPASS